MATAAQARNSPSEFVAANTVNGKAVARMRTAAMEERFIWVETRKYRNSYIDFG
jgi:hypothetical protein